MFLAESQMDSQSLQDESTLDPASPQDTVDDDNRSSSSSQDLLQSMDEISSGSLSPDTTGRASPLESGIGTASPPRSTDRRIVKRKSIIVSRNGTTCYLEIAASLRGYLKILFWSRIHRQFLPLFTFQETTNTYLLVNNYNSLLQQVCTQTFHQTTCHKSVILKQKLRVP